MFSAYDFGYSWVVANGLVVPLAIAVVVGAVAVWRRWPRWVPILSGLVAAWAAAGVILIHSVFGINSPMALPTERFLSSGAGRVLDAGAGSGRAAIGVLLARPGTTVTGLDIYEGYWGIDDNTPERFMLNARIAGVADRASTRTGDMREMPFPDGVFDAVVSSYAIDHLGRNGATQAIAEVARVLKPNGEFLLMIVNVTWRTWLVSPHAIAHHPRQDPVEWRAMLEQGGFSVEEEGTGPATRYFLATRRGPIDAQQ
jgi:SAM-dependent methyltransferase